MKYEITKGSEKDFEGAPKWAVLKFASYLPASLSDERINFWGDNKLLNVKTGSLITAHRETIVGEVIAERRQITKPVWDGEGLPPVGTKCEVQTSSNSPWFECEIVYSGESGAAFISTKSNSIGCVDDSCTDFFRPIRSPEDVARDEVIANICFEIGVRPNNIVVQQTYEAIAAGKIPGVKLE